MNSKTKILIKIIITIAILIVIAIINTVIMEARGRHATSGIGFIIFPAGVAAIFAVWRYKGNNTNEEQQLDKN